MGTSTVCARFGLSVSSAVADDRAVLTIEYIAENYLFVPDISITISGDVYMLHNHGRLSLALDRGDENCFSGPVSARPGTTWTWKRIRG